MAKAFLASLVAPAAVTLVGFSREEIYELHAEIIDLPRLDSSLHVALPRLVTPALNALLKAIEDDDVDALKRALPAVLATVDTPLERARLARAVIGLREAGRVSSAVAALALLDLSSSKVNSLITAALAQGASVALGVRRTPGGLLVAG